ncbi:MAG: GNAT family N-acetyltransferase [Armatimonadetes bacterium]|nr:GNAT family N-acetyltransferase [Armatimonadota bacterium]
MTVLIAQSPEDRAACFAIRERVFVQEQGVALDLEMDEWDAVATHFLLRDGQTGEPLATARLLNKDGLAKIGRVAVLAPARGRGLGMQIMQAVLAEARRLGFSEAVLDAQTYALPFYARLGFAPEGDEFDEAGIPHYTMRRRL